MATRSSARIAVVGLGALGAAALHALARRGFNVTGFESGLPGSEENASAGITRMFRVLYNEGGKYSALLRRARELWSAIEVSSHRQLFFGSGVASIGAPDDPMIAGLVAQGERDRVPFETMTAEAFARRYPQFRPVAGDHVVLDLLGGIVLSGEAIRAQVALAQAAGAQVHVHAPVQAIAGTAGGARIRTADGWHAFDAVVVAAGPWIANLLPALPVHIESVRYAFYRTTGAADFRPLAFPAARWLRGGIAACASMPMPDGRSLKFFADDKLPAGLAANAAAAGTAVGLGDFAGSDAGFLEACRAASDAGIARVLSGVEPAAPAVCERFDAVSSDGDPVLGALDDARTVFVAAAGSLHGFKLAPALAEIVAGEIAGEPALAGYPFLDVARFSGAAGFAPVRPASAPAAESLS